MKKSNWILFAILIVASAFLVWLWYFLGFNRVDSPLDLVLSVIWWIAIVVLVSLIVRAEKRRREEIRTIYLASGGLFNSEAGFVSFDEFSASVDAMEKVLDGLEYDFHSVDMPDEDKFQPDFVIRTTEFKEDSKDEDGGKSKVSSQDGDEKDDSVWKGTVIRIHRDGRDNESHDFDGRTALETLLA